MASPSFVIPAVDVLDGRVVRLLQGQRDAVTAEGGDPAAAIASVVVAGARRVHVVDLDGAFSGTPTPGLAGRAVAAADGVPVQIGGGFRTVAALEGALAAGAERVIVGTAALSPAFLAEALARFGSALVVAVDARDGRVAVDGWTAVGQLAPGELARRCADAGVARLLVTATRRDGTLAGPDLDLLGAVLAAGLPVIAAGGIARLEDLVALQELGCEAAVVGSALLRGRFTLAEALACVGAATVG